MKPLLNIVYRMIQDDEATCFRWFQESDWGKKLKEMKVAGRETVEVSWGAEVDTLQ